MAQECFTSIDQIKRDMDMGVFPRQSEHTKHELAERQRVFEIALESIEAGGPRIADGVKRGIARMIANKIVPTKPAPRPEYNGGDVPPV